MHCLRSGDSLCIACTDSVESAKTTSRLCWRSIDRRPWKARA